MLINEVCRECFLTKKAIEYYIEQGLLLQPYRRMGIAVFQTRILLF